MQRFHPVILCTVVLASAALAACNKKEEAAQPPKPAASAAVAAPSGPASAPSKPASATSLAATGAGMGSEALYQNACMGCHAEGVAGAPKLGDKQAWAPRIATGSDTLTQSVIQGKGSMPPKGTALNATEAELRSVVDYMVEKSQ